MIEVPAVVRDRARVSGTEGWLAGLSGLVADLTGEWSIRVGRLLDGGTEALVAEASLPDGTAAVLKLTPPGDAARSEITALRLAAGDGCARLLRDDADRGALLLERLGRPLHEVGLPPAARREVLCATARRVWRPAPGCGLPTGADKARRLAEFIAAAWERLDRPCSERAVADALSCAGRRAGAHDDERAVLVHGDVHPWNTLEAGGGFKLVDPDGLLAEAECELGVLMREDPEELLVGDPHGRARSLARRTGLDASAIWEWGAAERVSTGLLCTEIGVQPAGRTLLAVADRIAGAAPDR